MCQLWHFRHLRVEFYNSPSLKNYPSTRYLHICRNKQKTDSNISSKIVENWNLVWADLFITLVSEKFQYLFALDKILIRRLSNITSDKYLSGSIRSTISNSHVLTSYMTKSEMNQIRTTSAWQRVKHSYSMPLDFVLIRHLTDSRYDNLVQNDLLCEFKYHNF